MKPLILGTALLTLGLAACSSLATSPALPQAAALEARLEPARREAHVPLIAVAYIRDGQVRWTRLLGDADTLAAAGDSPLFNQASLTKPAFALMVLHQVETGEITLDTPLWQDWVDPDLADDPRHRQLTPRLALSHQTGLPNWRGRGDLAFIFDPGSRHEYSGEGFEYLRRALEKRTGRSMAALMEASVLAPAGMTDTHFGWQDSLGARFVPGDAGTGLESVSERTPNAAANSFGTIDDYGRFIAWVSRGAGMDATLFAQMQVSQARHPDPAEQFGLGWKLLPGGDETMLWHDGREAGLYNFALALPDRREGLVMLGKGQHGELLVRPLVKTLLADGDDWLARMDRQIWNYIGSVPREQLGPMMQFLAGQPSFTAKLLHAAHTSLLEPLALDATQEAAARDAIDALAFAMIDGRVTPEQVQPLLAMLVEDHAGQPRRIEAMSPHQARTWLGAIAAATD
ncbi:serine hydrolase domain-containing protein [Arenimonas aestuarii]